MSIHQTGGTWNGSSWVPNPTTATSFSYTAYTQPQPASSTLFPGQPTATAAAAGVNSAMPHPTSNHVEYYSRYYQYWTEQSKVNTTKAASMPPGPAKDEVVRTVAWADYYATQSAQYAHYYNNQKKQQTQPVTAIKAAVPNHSQPPPPSALNLPTPPTSSHHPQQVQIKKNLNLDKYESKEKSHEHSPTSPPSLSHSSLMAHTKSKKKKKKHDNPTESSYLDVVKGNSQKRKTNVNANTNGTSHKRSRVSKVRKSEEAYMNRMPVNDSYYGHSSAVVSEPESPTTKRMNHNKEDHFQEPPKPKKTPSKLIAKTSKQASSKKVNNGFESSKKILAKRANRFSGKGGLDNSSNDFTSQIAPTTKLGQYMGLSVIHGGGNGGGGTHKKSSKFKTNSCFTKGSLPSSAADKAKDYEKMTVKGTCTRLEKDFFRLTAPPQATMVRPQPILQHHLKNLKQIFVTKEHDYEWLCSQLKAVRQDLTVQRINNDFAVDVYETHARIALEEGDLNEYNQCQTQLKELYDLLEHKFQRRIAKGFGNVPGLSNQNEFIAYRIIYYVFLTGNKKYDGGSSDLFNIMLSLTSAQKTDPCIVHALKGKLVFLCFCVLVFLLYDDLSSFYPSFQIISSCSCSRE